jgi:hypothetical protein
MKYLPRLRRHGASQEDDGRALARGITVATHEVTVSSRKKIEISDACIGLVVRHLSPFHMLRTERAHFVLG